MENEGWTQLLSQDFTYSQLTIDLVFFRSIWMKYIEGSNKVTKINDSLPLDIKQIKDLHRNLMHVRISEVIQQIG